MKSFSILLVTGILLLFVPQLHASWFNDTQQCQGTLGEATSACAWGDYDNDGDQELFEGTGNFMGCHLWQKNANIFSDAIGSSGIDFSGVVAASCWGDFNSDGLLDLFIASGDVTVGSALYFNQGPNDQGVYTFSLPIIEQPFGAGNSLAGAICGDFNADGFLDLFIAFSDYNGSGPYLAVYTFGYNEAGDILFHEGWNYTDTRPPIDVVASDLDGDGDLDVFVVESGQCRLFRNLFNPQDPNNLRFEDQAIASGVNVSHGTSASFADYNYDGRFDLFITGSDPNTGSYLFRNDGSDEAHIAFNNVTADEFPINRPIAGNGSTWGDFDLDGDPDLYIIADGMDWLYQNEHREGAGNFVPRDRLTTGLGDDANSHCTAWADYDNNGKPDIFMGNTIAQDNGEYYDKLYHNVYSEHPENRYLSIKLIGANCGITSVTPETNKSAIGAKVRLNYRVNGIPTSQWGEVSGGGTGSHSQGSLPLEFGVGNTSVIDEVLVYWPSGNISYFENVSRNQRITIVEHGIFAGPGACMTWDWHVHGNYYFSGDLQFGLKDDLAGLTVLAGTKILAHRAYVDNQTPRIYFAQQFKYLTTYGNPLAPVIFSSQYTSSAPGDWKGLEFDFPDSIYLNGTVVSYASTGLWGKSGDFAPLDIQIDKCTFASHSSYGIDLYHPATYRRMNITNSRFNNCAIYGIWIRFDNSLGGYASRIANDTIINSANGINYYGRIHIPFPPDPNVPIIENCIVQSSIPNTLYGIYMSSIDTYNPDFWIIPRIENDSISGFSTGIWLQMIHDEGELLANRIKSNGSYGLYLQSSSPYLHASAAGIPNVFRANKKGLTCDGGSHPRVINTVFRDHISSSVMVQRRILNTLMPNFTGPNTFTQTSIPTGFHYIENDNLASLAATGNYWGANPPPSWAFKGPVNWFPCLSGDLYPGYGKRECERSLIPEQTTLIQNYPNPFNPTTEILFYLAEPGFASLKVYSITGQLVKTLVSGNWGSGEHQVIWDGKNSREADVASGIYFYVLSTSQSRASKTMTLLR